MSNCPGCDPWSYYDSFLILLANRFNSPYYLLLNAGEWSGGETSSGCRWLGVVETRQIVGLRKSTLRIETAAATEESFLFWG